MFLLFSFLVLRMLGKGIVIVLLASLLMLDKVISLYDFGLFLAKPFPQAILP